MFSRDGREGIGEKKEFFFGLHSHRPRVISSRQTIVSVAAFAGEKTHARREFIAARIARAETDIATQSVIPPSIVGALLRAYVLAYVCSMYKSRHIHIYARVYAEKPLPGMLTLRLFYWQFQKLRPRRLNRLFSSPCAKHKVRTFLPLSLSLPSPFILSRRLSGCAHDFSIRIESDT